MSLPTEPVSAPAHSAEPVWQLVGVVQSLSMARSLDAVMAIVRTAARNSRIRGHVPFRPP